MGSIFCAMINETEVLLDSGGSFSIQLPSERRTGGAFLVVDIYDLDNSVHPEGHVGWWRFEIDKLPGTLHGHVVRGEDGVISLKISGAGPFDEWRNPRRIEAPRLE